MSKLLSPTSDWNSSLNENQDKGVCQQIEDTKPTEKRIKCTVLSNNEGKNSLWKSNIYIIIFSEDEIKRVLEDEAPCDENLINQERIL